MQNSLHPLHVTDDYETRKPGRRLHPPPSIMWIVLQ